MSLPYPNDRARARQDNGEQPYKDAREVMNEQESNLQAQAKGNGDENLQESDEERHARMEQEAAERLAEVGEEVRTSNDQG